MTTSWRSRDELVHQIVTLARDGVSRRAITRAVGVSRNTVKAVLEAHAHARDADKEEVPSPPRPPTRAPRASKLDGFKPKIAELMRRYADITAQRVFEILRSEEGFTGGYTAVKKHLRQVRPAPKPTPSLTTPVYGPGEMAESDWSPYTMQFGNGSRVIVQALSYVLVSSTRKFFALYESNGLHALMDGHALAFERFRGCATRCKYDSQKPVVLRWEGNQPIYNPRFLAFSSHYEFRPLAVRRGHPDDKPRTERSFWEVERSFLNGRSFHDIDDMRAQLVRWLDETVDHRRRNRPTALERFAAECDHLIPLPRHPYDTARVVYRVCGIDGFVDWEGNRYYVAVTDMWREDPSREDTGGSSGMRHIPSGFIGASARQERLAARIERIPDARGLLHGAVVLEPASQRPAGAIHRPVRGVPRRARLYARPDPMGSAPGGRTQPLRGVSRGR
jgi:transposase